LTPNTGIGRFSLTVDPTRISDFVCESLHDAEHLGKNGFKPMPNIFGNEKEDEKIETK
jgi:hypothetical protein